MRDVDGFISLEFALVLGLAGLLTVTMLTAYGRVRQNVEIKTIQSAMLSMTTDTPDLRFPLTVTLDDLRVWGAQVTGYTIVAYSRTGKPPGADYLMLLETPKGTMYCLTAASAVVGPCVGGGA